MTHEQLAKAVGERIHAIRQKSGLTQPTVAHRAKCSVGDLSRYENGHKVPSLPTLLSIARALDVSIKRLVP
jgi:putative transcriptional regulator